MTTKTLIGHLKCGCGAKVPVKENEKGTINFSCAFCDKPAYAREGTEYKKRVMQRMEPMPDKNPPADAPAAKPPFKLAF